MTRLELLERVNSLNITAKTNERYWTVTLLYNTVIYQARGLEVKIFEVVEGVMA